MILFPVRFQESDLDEKTSEGILLFSDYLYCRLHYFFCYLPHHGSSTWTSSIFDRIHKIYLYLHLQWQFMISKSPFLKPKNKKNKIAIKKNMTDAISDLKVIIYVVTKDSINNIKPTSSGR